MNILFFAAALFAGRLLLRLTGLNNLKHRFLFAAVAGINIIAVLLYFAAVSGMLHYVPPVYLLIGFAVPEILRFFKGIRLAAIKTAPRIILHSDFTFLTLILICFLGASLSPAVGWDEMVYHQSVVERWMSAGRPLIYFDIPYSAFPSLSSFISWGIADSGTLIAPRLFIWCCWWLTLSIFLSLIHDCGIKGWKALAFTGAFALSRAMLFVVSDGYVETTVLMDCAAIILLLSATANTTYSGYKTAVVFGVLAGGAAAEKLTGAQIIVLPVLYFLVSDQITLKEKYKNITLCLFSMLLVALPFYMRSWIITGNPFYPYFCSLFSDSSSQIAMSRFHHAIATDNFGNKSIPSFLTAPILLSLASNNYDGNYGLQFILVFLGSIVAVLRFRNKMSAILYSSAAILYICWFFTAQQARFILPGVFICFYAFTLFMAAQKKNLQNSIIVILIVLTVISFPFAHSGYYYYSWAQVVGRLRTIDYLNTGTSEHYLLSVDAVMHLTPKNSKIMLLFEHRTLYFPRKTVIATPYFQEKYFTPIEEYSDIPAMKKELKKSGADYLLIAMKTESPDELPAYLKKYRKFTDNLTPLILDRTLKKVWSSKHYSLYKIRNKNQL